MKLLRSFKLRHFIIIFIILYVLLWLLDPGKAKGIFLGAVSVIDNLVMYTFHSSTSTPPTTQAETIKENDKLRAFLTKPNEALLKIRNGFYKEPAGYYIKVDQQGHCYAKTTEEFQGKWETPAKILCPQVATILTGTIPELPHIRINSGCQENASDAHRRGWSCEENE